MRKTVIVQPDPQSWLEKFHFSTSIKVRYCETDLLGHVNNVSYFMYFEQGRIEYFENIELTGELFGEQRVSVVADLACQYIAPVYLRDLIQLHVRVAHLGRSSIDLEYAIVVEGQIRAAGRGAIVLVDPTTKKSTPIPDSAKARIRAFEQLTD